MNNIKVSICCQTYNHVNYIEQCLEGFLMQKTNFKFEILLRDDASNDGTESIVKRYASKYKDIINPLIYEENQYKRGISPFRDNVKRAKGKYIALCEGDDYWTDPYKLQKQVDFLEANDAFSMIFTGATVLLEEKNIKEELNIKIESREYSGQEIFKDWIIPTASVLFRSKFTKEIIENLKFKGVAYGDIVVYLTLAEHGKIYCLNDKTCVYRRNSSGVTVSNPLSGHKAIQHFDAINIIFNKKYLELVKLNKSKVYLNIGILSLKKNELVGLKYLIYSIFYNYKEFFNYLKSSYNIKNVQN